MPDGYGFLNRGPVSPDEFCFVPDRGCICFLAVGLGRLERTPLRKRCRPMDVDVWNKASCINLCRAGVAALAAMPAASRAASALFVAGIVLFSGSLYLLALTNIKWLGAITPLGGLCFLAGWACLAIWPPR
jgi:uncharacterized membrane protein YgdD (TMEM256/DUF423 family)